jgi:hypothetical protein
MESRIATFEDATLILKLYELRREPVLRKARHWLIFQFNPETAEELLLMARGSISEENAYYRQVLSYWEMAASLVLHGAVKADLFLDSNGEGLYIYAKFHRFHNEFETTTGRPFMRNTAQMIERYPAAREIFGSMLKSIDESRS